MIEEKSSRADKKVALYVTILVFGVEDTSEYGANMSEELAELLKQDTEGKHRFDLLPPSLKRYVLNYVTSVKSQQLRIERAFLLISNLKQIPLGKENFRRILGKD